MTDLNPPIVVINGPARIGKTTMQNHLIQTYGQRVCMIEPSRALKIHFMMNGLSLLFSKGFKDDYPAYIEHMKANAEFFLSKYEYFKENNRVSRKDLILYAESIRIVCRTFWIDLAILLSDVSSVTELVWTEAINKHELEDVLASLRIKFPESKVKTIRLNCINSADSVTGDTRSTLSCYDEDYVYALQNSIHVADHIFERFSLKT
jgi:hypothetical protein